MNGKSGRRYEVGRITGDPDPEDRDIYEYLAGLPKTRSTVYLSRSGTTGPGRSHPTFSRSFFASGAGGDPARPLPLELLCGPDPRSGETGGDRGKGAELYGTLPDGAQYSVISQGGLSGAGGGAGRYLTCSVKINDMEYAVQSIGLNFVVYDNEHSVVADRWNSTPMTAWEPPERNRPIRRQRNDE